MGKDPKVPRPGQGTCKIWQVKVKVVPVVVGGLGTILKALGKHLDEIGTNVREETEGSTLGNSKDPKKDP